MSSLLRNSTLETVFRYRFPLISEAQSWRKRNMTHQCSRSHERTPASAYASAHASVYIHEGAHKSWLSLCDTIRTSWISPHHFIFQEFISVIISPTITPNKFWGFNKRNSQESYATLACPYREILHNLLHQNILRELIGVINSPRFHQKILGELIVYS